MGYNHLNRLRMYSNIIDLAMKHYEEGITNWRGIWKKHVYPVYPISYALFLKILAEPKLKTRIEEEEAKLNKEPNQ